MKKTTKKSAAKASRKRALKNLDVKPAKGGTVRGGHGLGDIIPIKGEHIKEVVIEVWRKH